MNRRRYQRYEIDTELRVAMLGLEQRGTLRGRSLNISEHQRGRDCRRIRYGVGCRHTGTSRILSALYEEPAQGWRSAPQPLGLPLWI